MSLQAGCSLLRHQGGLYRRSFECQHCRHRCWSQTTCYGIRGLYGRMNESSSQAEAAYSIWSDSEEPQGAIQGGGGAFPSGERASILSVRRKLKKYTTASYTITLLQCVLSSLSKHDVCQYRRRYSSHASTHGCRISKHRLLVNAEFPGLLDLLAEN